MRDLYFVVHRLLTPKNERFCREPVSNLIENNFPASLSRMRPATHCRTTSVWSRIFQPVTDTTNAFSNGDWNRLVVSRVPVKDDKLLMV